MMTERFMLYRYHSSTNTLWHFTPLQTKVLGMYWGILTKRIKFMLNFISKGAPGRNTHKLTSKRKETNIKKYVKYFINVVFNFWLKVCHLRKISRKRPNYSECTIVSKGFYLTVPNKIETTKNTISLLEL